MALSKLLTTTAAALDRRFGWDRLPRPLGVITLVGLRTRLRQLNLHDTGTIESVRPRPEGDRHLRTRTLDGSYNDLAVPTMGTIGARFGRNVPVERTHPEPLPALLEPNPRLVSRELLTRTEFKPATIVNVLAGAWLQFEVHDWFSHGKNVEEKPFELELAEDDDWPERPMRIQRTRPDASHPGDGSPPTYVTADSHWWDGSQIYGSDAKLASALRSKEGGKLRLDPDGQLPRDLESLVDLTGVAGNFWLGLALLHTLFTREHNAICDRLAEEQPDWSDDELYDRARLVNAALMAKIHTVEWTPAIIAHPTTRYAMRANWYGILGKRLGKRSSNEVLGGIPGSPTDHHGVPVLAHRGVRRRLPDAPAPAGRLHVSLARDRRGARRAELPRARRPAHARAPGRAGVAERVLLARNRASRRDHAAQLSALPPALRASRRDGDGPGRDRHPPRPRARCPALQRVPAALPPEAGRRASRS